MERLEKKIAPVYNNPRQVARCVASMLGCLEKNCFAELVLSIGWNGTGFATSTDWKIQTPRVRCILPPAVVPQYQTFVTMKAGMNIDYSFHQKGWQMTRDEKDAIILFPDGEKVFIKNGEAIEVKIQSGCSKFILSDCEVIEEECSDKRIFKIIENDHTQYGKYDGDVIFLL